MFLLVFNCAVIVFADDNANRIHCSLSGFNFFTWPTPRMPMSPQLMLLAQVLSHSTHWCHILVMNGMNASCPWTLENLLFFCTVDPFFMTSIFILLMFFSSFHFCFGNEILYLYLLFIIILLHNEPSLQATVFFGS